MKRHSDSFSNYDYSLLEVGPFRINQVDDSIIEKRLTQETFIIIPELSSEIIVYGEKMTSMPEETYKLL